MESLLLVLALLQAEGNDAPPATSKTTVTVSTDDSVRIDGRRDDGAGHVTVTQAKLSLELFHMEHYRDFFRLSGAAERIGYDFENTDEIDEAVAYRTDASWVHAFDRTWTGFLYGTLRSEFEPGADFNDALGGALGTGFMYRSSENLALGLILHGRYNIEKSSQLWPLPYVDWKINDRMRLGTEQKAGFGYTFTVGLDDPAEDGSFPWAAIGRARFQSRRIRHDSSGFNPDGILEDERFTIDVLFQHAFRGGSMKGTVGVYVGVEPWQVFDVEGPDGSNIDIFNTYAKPVFGLTGSLSF